MSVMINWQFKIDEIKNEKQRILLVNFIKRPMRVTITDILNRHFSRNKQVHTPPSSLSWGRTVEGYEVYTRGWN